MIVAIINILSSEVEEFRNEASEALALSKFCSAVAPPLDATNYLALDTTWQLPSSNLSKAWQYDATTQLLKRKCWKEDNIKKIIEHREYKLEHNIFLEYPAGSGLLFSCSESTQINLAKLASMDTKNLVSYPFPIYTADKLASRSLLDSAELDAFLALFYNTIITERAAAQVHINNTAVASNEEDADSPAAIYLAT